MIKRTSEEKKALDEKIGAYKVLGYTRDEAKAKAGEDDRQPHPDRLPGLAAGRKRHADPRRSAEEGD